MSFHTLAPYLTEGHSNSLVKQNVLIYLTLQFFFKKSSENNNDYTVHVSLRTMLVCETKDVQ